MKNLSIVRTFIFFLFTIGKVCGQTESVLPNKSVIISGYFEDGNSVDTVIVNLYDHFLSEFQQQYISNKTFAVVINEGHFSFSFEAPNHPTYFSLSYKKKESARIMKPILNLYLCKRGDNVSIGFGKMHPVFSKFRSGEVLITDLGIDSIVFSGSGSAKYKYLYERDKLRNKRVNELMAKGNEKIKKNGPPLFTKPGFDTASQFLEYPNRLIKANRNVDSILAIELSVLDKHRISIDRISYSILQADLIGFHECQKVYIYAGYLSMFKAMLRPSLLVGSKLKSVLLDSLNRIYLKRKIYSFENISSDALANSKEFTKFIVYQATYISDSIAKENAYFSLKSNFRGSLRDKVVTDYLLFNLSRLNSGQTYLQDALSVVKTDYCWQLLNDMLNNQKVGTQAYNFSLPDINGANVQLSDFRDKIVFIDFWFTGCGGCRLFYENVVAKTEDVFKDNPNIVFITISIDTDRKIWVENVKNGGYTSFDNPNVINLYTGGSGTAHPLTKAFNVVFYPQPLIIDRQGKIYKVSNVKTRTPEELIGVINAALLN